MRENEDVWIVIPVYGEEKVIASVVDHVLQVFPNVVCVDDGSPDNSAASSRGCRFSSSNTLWSLHRLLS